MDHVQNATVTFRLALGSFVEEYNNRVQIVQLDDDLQAFVKRGEFDHPYPTTKIMWRPDEQGIAKDQVATTGDYLRLWDVGEKGGWINPARGDMTCLAPTFVKTESAASYTVVTAMR